MVRIFCRSEVGGRMLALGVLEGETRSDFAAEAHTRPRNPGESLRPIVACLDAFYYISS